MFRKSRLAYRTSSGTLRFRAGQFISNTRHHVNDQRPLLEEIEQILVTSSCEVRSSSKADAILIADAFLEPERYGCSPKEFKARFAMLGLTLSPTLGTELYVNLNSFPVDNSRPSHWGKV